MSDTVNNSEQRKIWKGSFGDEYVDRSTSIESVNKRFLESRGISLEDIIKYFFSDIDRNSAILELGCNVGLNLSILKKLGFKKLSGVEINKKAYEIASENNPEINQTPPPTLRIVGRNFLTVIGIPMSLPGFS